MSEQQPAEDRRGQFAREASPPEAVEVSTRFDDQGLNPVFVQGMLAQVASGIRRRGGEGRMAKTVRQIAAER
jgi:hypothetical protein